MKFLYFTIKSTTIETRPGKNVKMFDPDNQAAQEGLKISEQNKSINMDYISVWHNFAM